jgi:putative heme-binding domain-containing protein
VKLAGDANTDMQARLRYFRAFDFIKSPKKTQAMLQMIADNKNNDVQLNAVLLQGLNVKDVQRSPVAKRALNDVVKSVYGTKTYIDLAERYGLKDQSDNLLKLALSKPEDELATEAINLIFKFQRRDLVANVLKSNDSSEITSLLTAMSRAGDWPGMKQMQTIATSRKYSDSVRSHALRMLGRSWGGGDMINELIQSDKLPQQLIPAALEGIEGGPQKNIIIDAKQHLSNNKGAAKPPFDRDSVLALAGNATKGAAIFKSNCSICHQVKGEGTDFGPKLSEIGTKLPKDALLDAIVDPSSGISFGYETTELVMKNGSSLRGLLSDKSPTEFSMKLPGGTVNKVKASDVKLVKKLPSSMMPDLHETMSKQDLADLLAYLGTLKKK